MQNLKGCSREKGVGGGGTELENWGTTNTIMKIPGNTPPPIEF